MENRVEKRERVVFYSATTPTAMLYKISKLFKKNNYETVLFAMCGKDMFDWDFYGDGFDKITCSDFQFRNPTLKNLFCMGKKIFNLFKFLIRMKLVRPSVVVGVAGNHWQVKLSHKYFFKKYPFVYFPYDILSHFFSSREKALKSEIAPRISEIEAEKYLFENSDGILHKGSPDELKPVEGRLSKNINFTPLELNFLPYCSEEFNFPINKNKLSKKDGELHLVYTGFLANNLESANIFRRYFREIVNQKIHMHVYTFVTHVSKEEEKRYINDFFQDIIGNKYLHLHKPLDPKQIVKEISKYDFALWLAYETNEDNIEAIHSTGNKISTYLEAGLPVIYNENCVFLDQILSPHGLRLSFTKDNLSSIKKRLLRLNYEKLIKNLKKLRNDFDMDKNFPRLEDFIKKIIAKKHHNSFK